MPHTIAECRMRAHYLMPYLHQAIMSMTPVQRPGLETFAVDQWGRMYFDPELLHAWGLDQCAAAILHEVMHITLDVHKRAIAKFGERPSRQELSLFNIAHDIAINDSLKEAKSKNGESIAVGKDWVYSDTFGFAKNLTAEAYYDLLCDLPKQKQPGTSGDGDGSGWVWVDSGGDNGSGDTNGMQSGRPEIGKGACGGCCDGQQHHWEEGRPESEGGDSKVNGIGDFEREMIRRQVAENIDQYQRKNGRGTVPGSLSRMAEEILRPKTDPARELLAMVKFAVNSTHGHGDYTWKRMSRRQPAGSVRLPAHIQPVPRVTAIIDTSGSMGPEDLGLALGVIGQVLKALPSEGVRVICGDAAIQSVKTVFRPEQTELCGGGGTDMGAIAVQVAQQRPRPDVILVVTDGYTPWPESPLESKVVACVTQEHDAYPVPEWIKRVVLNPED